MRGCGVRRAPQRLLPTAHQIRPGNSRESPGLLHVRKMSRSPRFSEERAALMTGLVGSAWVRVASAATVGESRLYGA